MIPSARAGSCQTCASYRLEIFALRHAVALETRTAVAAQRPAGGGTEATDQVPAQSLPQDRSLQELARRAEEALERHLAERHAGSTLRQEAGALDLG